jgi:hypothetical protein
MIPNARGILYPQLIVEKLLLRYHELKTNPGFKVLRDNNRKGSNGIDIHVNRHRLTDNKYGTINHTNI